MTDKQKELLATLGETFHAIAEECMNDEKFHQVMIENNDLFPMSLDEMGAEWYAVIEGDRKRIK